MLTRDYLADLSSSVSCYLRTLSAAATCVAKACPEIGGPYGERLSRLRARLSFDASPTALLESAGTVESELLDYASAAARYVSTHGIELRRGMVVLEEMVESFAKRQETYTARLDQLAARMEAGPFSAELRDCIGSMDEETASVVRQMRQEMAAVEERLQGIQSVDAGTGLINAAEMNRQIEAHEASRAVFTLLLFDLRGPISEQLMRQAAKRLAGQFRHRDRVARWNATEFMVLFRGTADLAQARVDQVTPQLAARYVLDNGQQVDISVHTRVREPELAPA